MKITQYVNNSLLLAIGSGYDTVWRDLNLRLKKEDCNLLQALILISIFFEQSDAVNPSGLAEIFRTTRGNISHCVSHLERRGFLKRALDEGDARRYRLLIKPEGRKTALRLMRVIDELENYFEKQLGKQGVQSTIENITTISAAYRRKSRLEYRI